MASRLPTIPRLVFTVFEPLSLLAGWAGATLNPAWFVTEQTSTGLSSAVDDNARLVALQLGNTYGLVFLVASAVLYTTSEIKVVRNYLIACWIADISHVYVCYHVLGWVRFANVAGWNSMTWGNVGVTTMLCLTRTAYLLGFFGPDVPVATQRKLQ
ncbi:hypothetical protein M406DRAFT_259831 [Cryphonectria parasitica EP155]|uniref:DUF7704 domain-containing protein n=1 Tax=Cryphonectria parasitica (strain ATCC 38755 / EP155) TaxID=660469 RepID=A0A9P4Y1U6_CRYP1|nr:uncharacterized protein M406DRAFT_259831 [Cryphonectria parasitica EP155]KAF3765118.1 hypothetical protein M406DRAFT_259831 [Cryphonectria parasitica EP155]